MVLRGSGVVNLESIVHHFFYCKEVELNSKKKNLTLRYLVLSAHLLQPLVCTVVIELAGQR